VEPATNHFDGEKGCADPSCGRRIRLTEEFGISGVLRPARSLWKVRRQMKEDLEVNLLVCRSVSLDFSPTIGRIGAAKSLSYTASSQASGVVHVHCSWGKASRRIYRARSRSAHDKVATLVYDFQMRMASEPM